MSAQSVESVVLCIHCGERVYPQANDVWTSTPGGAGEYCPSTMGGAHEIRADSVPLFTEADVRSMTATCDLDGWYAIHSLRRLLASNLPHGHEFRPIKPEDVHIIEAANAEDYRDEDHRSVRCWDCRASGDRPISPSSDRTWGDEWHEQHEAFKEARALLASIDGSL